MSKIPYALTACTKVNLHICKSYIGDQYLHAKFHKNRSEVSFPHVRNIVHKVTRLGLVLPLDATQRERCCRGESSVRPSVTLMDCEQIHWDSREVILRINSVIIPYFVLQRSSENSKGNFVKVGD